MCVVFISTDTTGDVSLTMIYHDVFNFCSSTVVLLYYEVYSCTAVHTMTATNPERTARRKHNPSASLSWTGVVFL